MKSSKVKIIISKNHTFTYTNSNPNSSYLLKLFLPKFAALIYIFGITRVKAQLLQAFCEEGVSSVVVSTHSLPYQKLTAAVL